MSLIYPLLGVCFRFTPVLTFYLLNEKKLTMSDHKVTYKVLFEIPFLYIRELNNIHNDYISYIPGNCCLSLGYISCEITFKGYQSTKSVLRSQLKRFEYKHRLNKYINYFHLPKFYLQPTIKIKWFYIIT